MIKALQVGLGPIGLRVAELMTTRRDVALVGAVDPDPAKAGRKLSDLLGAPLEPDVRVVASLEELAGNQAAVAAHCTGSHLQQVKRQLLELAAAGLNVVSTCEELAFPWHHHPDEAAEIDRAAKDAGVTILGAGVNPGFVCDALPLMLSNVCQRISRVRVERVGDARMRRGPFQRKIGAGLTPEEFRAEVEAGRLGHVGFPESVAMIASGLGWDLERTEQTVEPVIAEREIKTTEVAVTAGEVCGLRQQVRGWIGGEPRIELRLEAYLGAPEPTDLVRLEGVPELELRIPGGTHGDLATVASVVNYLGRVVSASPGLKTVAELAVGPRMAVGL